MSEEEKLNFAESIGTLTFDDNIELFKMLLGDESFRVRKTALESLLRTQQSNKLTYFFIDIINSQDNAGLRTAGVEGLTRIGREAVGKIVKAIDVEQWELSKLLVDVLGDIGDPEVVPVLIKLTSSPQQNLSTASIEALGKIGTEDIIPYITELLKQKEIYIVFSALEALANLGKKGFKLPIENIVPLMDDQLLKKAAFDLLGSTHDPLVISYLIEGIKDNKRSNRDSAAKALLQLYNSLNEQDRVFIKNSIRQSSIYDSYIMEKMLSSVDSSIVMAGIRILGWSGVKSNINTILKYADDPDIFDACVASLIDIGDSIRADVVGLLIGNNSISQIKAGLLYLSQLQDYVCAPPDGLEYLLEVDDTEEVTVLLARTLGTYIDAQSLKLLVKLMASESKAVNTTAIDNFVKIGRQISDQALEMIHGMVHSSDYLLRLAAARLILNFYNENMGEDIKTLLNDSEAAVRAATISTIGILKLDRYIENIQMALTDENKDVRIEAVRATANIIPEKFIDTIKWLINDDDQWVKIEIIKHLKHSPQIDEANKILKLYTNDGFPAVMLTAIQVLIDTSIDDCINEIEKVLANKDPDIVMEVVYMLGKANNKTARNILKDLSSSPEQKIREKALSVLERYTHTEDH
jgi:HEAT repeat protein